MKKCGYDAIVIHGASKNPVFLEISDEGVKFHSAEDIWGKDTYETDDICKKRIVIPEAQVMVIGSVGENLVRL
jgi:aldehyde:ferredoxin oxidoreductase